MRPHALFITGLFTLTACDTTRIAPETPAAQLPVPARPELLRGRMYLSYAGIFIRVNFGDVEPLLMRFDTGSPITFLDPVEAARHGLEEGSYLAGIDGHPLGERRLRLHRWIESEYAYADLPPERIAGVVGNDFFKDLLVGLDYQKRELWVRPSLSSEAPPPRAGTGAPVQVPMESGSGYLIVPAAFAADGELGECLLDLGARVSFAFSRHWPSGATPYRRKVPSIATDFRGSRLEGYFQRTPVLRVGELSVAREYVAICDEFASLTAVGRYLDRDIAGLIGIASTLRHHTVIDYGKDRVLFYPYDDLSHLPESPFHGFGFLVESAPGGGLSVAEVVEGSEADKAGVVRGDRVLRIDDRDVDAGGTGLDVSAAMLLRERPGRSSRFVFERDGEHRTLELLAEDLLPEAP